MTQDFATRCERALADYREWVAGRLENVQPHPNESPDQIFGVRHGHDDESARQLYYSGVDSLEALRFALDGEVYRGAPDELAAALATEYEYQSNDIPHEHVHQLVRVAPMARHWFVLFDRASVVPITLRARDRESFARRWRDGVPELRGSEAIVQIVPGWPVEVILWSEAPRTDDEVRAWARSLAPRDEDEDGARFKPVAYPWQVAEFETLIYLPAASAPARGLRHLTSRRAAAPSSIQPTGIAALDAVLVGGGLPRTGARVIVQAPTASAKTAFMLEAAEAAASNTEAAWIATRDEPADSLSRRRLQRLGLSRVEALGAPLDDPRLERGLTVVDGREFTLEDVLELKHEFQVLFLDTLQKVRLRDAPTGEIEHVRRALEQVETSGLTVWMTSAVVRGAGRRAASERARGGSQIEAGATLLLDLALDKNTLTVSVLKSRHGGEGAVLELELDRERQRILSPCVLSVEERIERDVCALLAAGPMSERALIDKVTGRDAVVRAVIRSARAAGRLVKNAGRVGLP